MVFASLHPGTQATKRSTSQIKFHTFSLGTWISTSFSNCKGFPPQTQFFFAIRSRQNAQLNASFHRRPSRENGCGFDRPFAITVDDDGQQWTQGKVCKSNRFPQWCFLDP